MGPFKALGSDGYHAIFFQKNWSIVGNSICNFYLQVLNEKHSTREFNKILIVLIPKVENPERVNQLRPISLCNVTYKLITKSIVNRIKVLLPDIISPYQSSFVPCRYIIENVVLVQEIIHSM